MSEKNYYGLDIAKFISALLVIAIHTAPLMDLNETANFVFVQIIARIAVPFFFITSGFLFFRHIDMSREWNDDANITYLKHYEFRIFRMYLIWTILYLPFRYLLMNGDGGISMQSILMYIRDFFVQGSYYHLWFLPSLMFAIFAVYVLRSYISMKHVLITSGVLYILGMIGNVYGDTLSTIPVVSNIFECYTQVFVTTRNGLFFGMIFIAMGACVANRTMLTPLKGRYLGFIVAIVLLCVESFGLRELGIMKDLTSMYLMLLPVVWFLFQILITLQLKKREIYRFLRTSSLLIYTVHIMFTVVLFTFVPHLDHLMIYLITAVSSFIISIMIYVLSKKLRFLRYLY